jgi:S-adenosylmethionine:tRNA ribosyltransferase-isomerase
MMKLSDFDYDLPEDRIAKFPLTKRDDSRLMVVNRNDQSLTHDYFYNLDRYLPQHSTIIFNDTKVIPARLLGHRHPSGGQVEVFVLNPVSGDGVWEVLLKPLRRLRNGDELIFDQGYRAVVVDRDRRHVRFSVPDIIPMLEAIGHMPLPPYIQRLDTAEDRQLYQTVYARDAGSVAAPTAGRHFTDDLLKRLREKNHYLGYLTLHINYGTFKPVECETISEHPMHHERYSLDPELWTLIEQRRQFGHPLVAVGTTSCRVLETVARGGALKGETDLFIYPPDTMKIVDALITNFHLPRSTLLMLVSAFSSVDLMRRAYQEAINKGYRFYSYGDSMLII